MKKNEEKEKAADKCVFVWWMSQGDVDTDACPLLYLQRFDLCTLSIVWRVHTHTSGRDFGMMSEYIYFFDKLYSLHL